MKVNFEEMDRALASAKSKAAMAREILAAYSPDHELLRVWAGGNSAIPNEEAFCDRFCFGQTKTTWRTVPIVIALRNAFEGYVRQAAQAARAARGR